MWTQVKVENRNSGDSEKSGEDSTMNETTIRKRLHNMCYRPRRIVIPFLDGKADMSLFTFLRQRAEMPGQICPEEGCGKPLLTHTNYWYHGDGSLEIDSVHDKKDSDEHVILHVYCTKCKRIVMKQEHFPTEVLEMSFFKFIEHFFYNKQIKISPNRNQEFLGDHPACEHSLFGNCELTFRYQQVKTTMKFEHMDAHSLDLYHFGLEKGTVSDDKKRELVA